MPPNPPPDDTTIPLNTGGGGGGGGQPESTTIDLGGGGGGSSSSGGGGGTPVDPHKAYRDILFGLRINPGPFVNLIDQAVKGKWGSNEFLYSLSTDPQFFTMFPGIESLLDQGLSIPGAISTWRKMATTYQNVAADLGLSHLARLTPKRIGQLVAGNVDAEEFQLRLSILQAAKNSDAFRDAFNRILRGNGQQALDKQGWYRFLMGQADRKLYDTYEAAQILQELGPEGIGARQARKLARAAGTPGAPADLSEFVANVSAIRQKLGTVALEQAGLKTADIAAAALRDQLSGNLKRRADATLTQLEQMFRNRDAQNAGAVDTVTTVAGEGRPVSASAPQGELAG
jgi:hypothetical protein